MLKVFSGRFHPSLENAFKSRIVELKKAPFSPLLIVVPTSRLSERLQLILAKEGDGFLNLHFHTFSSLIEQLAFSDQKLTKPILNDSLFYDTAVKFLLKENKFFPEIDDLAVPEGFPPAVRSSLRDLIEAGVDENNVEVAIREEFLGQPVDLGSLRSLLNLLRSYLRKIKTLPVYPRSELVSQAIDQAPISPFLKKFQEIIFYGFYDMPGFQIDLFHAIVKNHPSQLFFPFVSGHPSFSFAKRFRDSFLQPVIQDEVFLEPPYTNTHGNSAGPKTKIFNVSGVRDEAWFVASEIQRLHQDEKIPFSDMAIIARSEERLKEAFPEKLSEWNIPARFGCSSSLSEFPQTLAAREVLDWVNREIPEHLLADFSKWPEFNSKTSIDLLKAMLVWPEKDSWENYIQKTIDVLDSFFNPLNLESEKLWGMLKDGVGNCEVFSLLKKQISWRDFLDSLFERWAYMEVSQNESLSLGVSLLHAEIARGLSFRVVFLVGLEEKVFPRVVREDPFLRDDVRLALNATLGYKINQKSTALEEERLLFEYFTHAASNYLVLIYQRSDEAGNVIGASSFLRSFAEEKKINLQEEVKSLPRSLLRKIALTPPQFLSSKDIVRGFFSSDQSKKALDYVKAIQKDFELLKNGIESKTELQSFEMPGSRDGLVGTLEEKELFRKGKASATALETYGLCPYKYFAQFILGLEPVEENKPLDDLEPSKKGELIHLYLEKFFRRLTKEGSIPPPQEIPEPIFEEIFKEVFHSHSASQLGLRWVLWEAIKIQLHEKLKNFIEDELIFLAQNNIQPIGFEKSFSGILPEISKTVEWTGKLDRIDQDATNTYVIDYKSGKTLAQKNVVLSSLRGLKSQAPLYLLMTDQILLGKKEEKETSFSYLYLFKEGSRLSFSSEEWKEYREDVLQTIREQVGWMKNGEFIMMPDEPACSYCEVAQICRKNNPVSVVRSERGVGEKFWKLRERKINE